MKNPRGDDSPATRRANWELPGIRSVVYAVALVVAAFAFIVSYSHIYDLGRTHAQSGTAGRLLPLSVDLLIVAASLVLFMQSRQDRPDAWLARWMPRVVLWAGIGATVAANVAYGLPHGWLAAVISGWPGASFVGVVEMVLVAVRPGQREGINHTLIPAVQGQVPASAYQAAEIAYAASVAACNPLGETALAARFGIPRTQARKIRTPPVVAGAVSNPQPAPATLNGSAPDA